MRKTTFSLTFSGLILGCCLFVLHPVNAVKSKNHKQNSYTFTGTYNPVHRTQKTKPTANQKKQEAFWAAFCNIAVNLARQADQAITNEDSAAPGWSVHSQVAALDVIAVSDASDGEYAVCTNTDKFAITTRNGEFSSLIGSDQVKVNTSTNTKWPASVAGIRIIKVQYNSDCTGDECECTMSVESP